jgi:flagellar motility protein MotE (MotC chaperone)
MKRLIAMLLALLVAMPLAAGAQGPGRQGGAWKGAKPAPSHPQRSEREDARRRQLSQDERRQLHRDLDQADQEIYRRKGGR